MDKTAEQSYRDDEWLVKQLRAWPERVDMGKTTSITYLMQSAADEIDRLAALSARPAVAEDVVERIVDAVIDAANIVSHDGYYEIDRDAATRAAIAAITGEST